MSATQYLPLDEYLVDDVAPADEDRERFRIDGLQTAEWAAAKLRRALLGQATARSEYEAWKAKADQWLADRLARDQHDVDYFTYLLTRWHRELRELDERQNKTVALPSGTRLVSRAGHRLPKVEDEAVFLAWAKEHDPALVRTKESVDLKALAAEMKRTGEVPPGVTVEETETSFRVEVDL